MGWGTHPDTIAIGMAQGIVRSQAIASGTLKWQKAYRIAYEQVARRDYLGLEDYLKRLDDDIARREQAGPG